MEVTQAMPDTETFKKGAVDLIQKGKKKLGDRLKIIKFADRDGWHAALLYEGDNLAEDDSDTRRMKNSNRNRIY